MEVKTGYLESDPRKHFGILYLDPHELRIMRAALSIAAHTVGELDDHTAMIIPDAHLAFTETERIHDMAAKVAQVMRKV